MGLDLWVWSQQHHHGAGKRRRPGAGVRNGGFIAFTPNSSVVFSPQSCLLFLSQPARQRHHGLGGISISVRQNLSPSDEWNSSRVAIVTTLWRCSLLFYRCHVSSGSNVVAAGGRTKTCASFSSVLTFRISRSTGCTSGLWQFFSEDSCCVEVA